MPATPRNPPTGRLCRRSDTWERPKTWPRWCACFADPMRATSPDRRSTSTAALTCHDCHDHIAIVDRAAAGHAHPRGLRRDASGKRMGRRRRARGPSDVPELGSAARSARRAIRRWTPRSRPCASSRPAPRRALLGRSERVDIASAALLNGIASHTVRFRRYALEDDHPSRGPRRVGGAGARRAPRHALGGRSSMRIVIGIDVECRVGNAIYPDHYDRGWHITGSTGMLGRRRGLRAAAPARRAADRHGARHRGVATDRRARAVRLDDQAVSRRRRRARGAHRRH